MYDKVESIVNEYIEKISQYIDFINQSLGESDE